MDQKGCLASKNGADNEDGQPGLQEANGLVGSTGKVGSKGLCGEPGNLISIETSQGSGFKGKKVH